MVWLRRALVLVLCGAFLGDAVATLIARAAIVWYNTPGDLTQGQQQICILPQVVGRTIDELVKYQALGAAMGGAVFLVVGVLVFRRRGAKPAAPAPATGTRP